jgi:hypothetical protein
MPAAVGRIAGELYVTTIDTSSPDPEIGIRGESGDRTRVSSWNKRHFVSDCLGMRCR